MNDQEARQILGRFFDRMFAEAQHVEELAPDDAFRRQGEIIGQCVTSIVGYLSNYYPNPRVRRLMGWVWNLIGSRTTPTAMSGVVNTPTVIVIGGMSVDEQRAAILLPPGWPARIIEDPVMAMGAMVFCGSQVVDFYNDKAAEGSEQMHERARAYEAEFLRSYTKIDPSWQPNAYQQRVLALPDDPSMFYESREVPTSTPIES